MHVQNTVLYFWEKLSNTITKFNSCPRDQYSLYASCICHGYRHSVVALVVLHHHTFLVPSHFHYRSKRIRNSALGVSFSGMTHMSNFIKICKVVIEFNAGTRQACPFVCSLFSVMFCKQRISWLIWSPLLWAARPHTHSRTHALYAQANMRHSTDNVWNQPSHASFAPRRCGRACELGHRRKSNSRVLPITCVRIPVYLPFSKHNTVLCIRLQQNISECCCRLYKGSRYYQKSLFS